MIEMHEDEFSDSPLTDDQLRYILRVYGPKVKDMFLLPRRVPVEVQHDINRDSELDVGTPRRGNA